MKHGAGFQLLVAVGMLLPSIARPAEAQNLQVTYGSKGVQTLSYGGVTLEDAGANPGDAFHIWHTKLTDLQGNVLTSGQYGWGETNSGEAWNAATNTETYTFTWGTVATQFVQSGNNLDIIVTETNYSSSNVILDGVEIFPFALHFPHDPTGFNGNPQYAITTLEPGVSIADFGSGVVTSVIPNESVALYGGWKNQGNTIYSPIMTSTAPDGLATFLPHNDYPVQPGGSFTYTVSLRFTPEGTAGSAADAYASFAATYPSQMTWTDKRIIGTAYLASSPAGSGDITQPGGFPTNPRRYFNDSTVDVTTPSGLQAFQKRMLQVAAGNVTDAQALNAQGVITWDIEGEQYPQSTSYVCSPDQIAMVAPEMESTITDPASEFFGRKLDDAYFQTMTGAGLKVGVCLRPQVFTLTTAGTASQVFLSTNAAIVSNLESKARYANARWGATIFYVDSTVDVNGGTLDPAIFQQIITDLPSFLFIPEESTPRYYAYTAPFYSFLFHTDLGTPTSTYNFYPKAFGANLVNDVSASTLATYQAQLTQAVARGDILMGHADFWQANDPTLVAIYAAAGGNTSPPQQVTPVITWAAPTAIAYGSALSGVQLNAIASVPGSFVYNPAAGTALSAGNHTLMVTFTPTDSADYKSTTASTSITVSQATPAITWPAPASIASGTALSATQLNATANVPGSFSYAPSSGAVLGAGTNTLTVTFTPTDTTGYVTGTASVSLTVTSSTQATPTLSWSAPAAIAYGTALSAAQLNAIASVPGSFVYSPAAGAVLGAGNHTLMVTFTPTDSANYKSTTASATLTVSQAAPTITWPAPASIAGGTALSATQLNATANVPGSFSYAPSSGAVLGAGTNTLTVTFTPTDTTDYATGTAAVNLTVTSSTQTTPTLSWSAPAAIAYGTALSGVQLNATASVPGSFVYNPAAGTVLSAGNHTLTVTFTPTDTTRFTGSTANVTLTVGPVQPSITFTVPNHFVQDLPFAVQAASNSSGAFTYAIISGPATVSGNVVSLTGAGTVTLQVSQGATADYAASTALATFVVQKVATLLTLVATPTSVTPMQNVVLTAAIATAVAAQAAGTVTIFDGGVQLGSPISVSAGTANLVTTLSSGTHVLTAVYSGDANLLGSQAAGTTVTVAPLDFSIAVSGSSNQTVAAGSTAKFSLLLTPTYGVYPGNVTVQVTGLPPGATSSLSQTTVVASAGSQTVALTIQTAPEVASGTTGNRVAFAFALMLPLLGITRLRRFRGRLTKLLSVIVLLSAGLMSASMVSGCGSGAAPQSVGSNKIANTITVTASSGAVQHSTNISLQIQ